MQGIEGQSGARRSTCSSACPCTSLHPPSHTCTQVLAVSGFQLGTQNMETREMWMVQFYNQQGEGGGPLSLQEA